MGWQDDPVVVKGRPKWESDPIVSVAPASQVANPGMPAIDIRPGSSAPSRITASANPYSAGLFPLGRTYTVGDEATMRETDYLTGVEKRIYTLRVTRVDIENDRIEINNGKSFYDLMGNTLKAGEVEYDVPVQFTPAEFQIGKKWRAAFIRTDKGGSSNAFYDVQIVRREKVAVPAGEFDAFKIEGRGWNTTRARRNEVAIWMVPGLIFPVKREWITRAPKGRFTRTERHELVSLRQQAVGI